MKRKKKRNEQDQSPLWLLVRNIDSPHLQKLMFERFAPSGAKTFNWKRCSTLKSDERASALVASLEELRETNLAEFKGLYGALTIVGIAGEVKSIQMIMRTFIEENALAKKLYNHDTFMHDFCHDNLDRPAHRAAWFAIKEELKPLWEEIVRLANTEQSRNLHWTYFNVSEPEREWDDDGLDSFAAAFKKKMEAVKKYEFPVTVQPYPPTGNFVRFVISTPKDPMLRPLVDRGSITIGLDPTANNFFLDWFFDTHTMRVTYPTIADEQDVAQLFSEHVFGSKINEEPKLYYRESLRHFTSARSSARLLELSDEDKREIAVLRICSIDFTYAETEDEANARKRLAAKRNKKDVYFTGELHPAFKCHKYDGVNIWSYLDSHFPPERYPSQWRTVLSIKFAAELYCHDYSGGTAKTVYEKTRSYSISVGPNSIRYSPKWHEIADPQHRVTLKYIAEQKLGFVGLTLEQLLRGEGEQDGQIDEAKESKPNDTLL